MKTETLTTSGISPRSHDHEEAALKVQTHDHSGFWKGDKQGLLAPSPLSNSGEIMKVPGRFMNLRKRYKNYYLLGSQKMVGSQCRMENSSENKRAGRHQFRNFRDTVRDFRDTLFPPPFPWLGAWDGEELHAYQGFKSREQQVYTECLALATPPHPLSQGDKEISAKKMTALGNSSVQQ